MTGPQLSVIIITKNNVRERNQSLLYVLQSLQRQSHQQFEIIIVDDGSTDSTTERLTDFEGEITLLKADSDGGRLGSLRNQGARLARADTLVFLDDDTYLVDRDALSMIHDHNLEYDFMCGARRLWSHLFWHRFVSLDWSVSTTTSTLRDLAILPKGINRQSGFRDLNEFTFIGNFGAVRRSAFDEVGGFSDNYVGLGLEDTELMMRLCLKGFDHRILFDEISVVHLNHVQPVNTCYLDNLRRFQEIELQLGYHFHVNHFFGVYEGDGHAVLTQV